MTIIFARNDKYAADDGEDELLMKALPVAEEEDQGENNIESMDPPSTGEEYLRRVRQEANRCAAVVRVEIDRNKLKKQDIWICSQDIPATREELLPSRSWKTQFLAEFTELRQQLHRYKTSKRNRALSLPSVKDSEAWRALWNGKMQPLLSAITQLTEFEVNNLLEIIVTWEGATHNAPSSGVAEWIFALMVAVEKPLPPSTAAAFRVILNRCYQARANLERDPSNWQQLAMLNILIVISGDFFGQAGEDYQTDNEHK